MNLRYCGPKEDCFDKEFIWEFIFEEEISESDLKCLKSFGKLEIFSQFAAPFFRFCGTTGLQIKGTVGTKKITVFFTNKKSTELIRLYEILCIQGPEKPSQKTAERKY